MANNILPLKINQSLDIFTKIKSIPNWFDSKNSLKEFKNNEY